MDEEFNRAGVPRGMMAQGPSMLVPTLAAARNRGAEEALDRADHARRGHLVPGLFGARCGQRSRQPADGGAGGRRRLRHQRPEDLDEHRRQGADDVPARAHGARSQEARGHLLSAGAHGHPGPRGAAPPHDGRRHRGEFVQPGLLHGRSRAHGESRRPSRRGVEDRQHHPQARAQQPQRQRRGPAAAADEADARRDRERRARHGEPRLPRPPDAAPGPRARHEAPRACGCSRRA